MATEISYPVKIHLPDCKCNHYRGKVRDRKKNILVSPHVKRDFNQKYYIYDSYEEFEKDIELFTNNCICTYSNGIYNGGIVLLSKNKTPNLNFSESKELINLQFAKLRDIQNIQDNSNLINKFCQLFPSFLSLYTLIGETIKFVDEENHNVNHTFPKGKISAGESVNECCHREFYEETNCNLDKKIISADYQINIRKSMNLDVLPLNIIINNFYLIIILI
jgi:hypothetical protein